MFLAEELDAEQPDRIVVDAPSIACCDGKHIGVSIDCLDAPITSLGNDELLAPAHETNYVALFIVVGARALRTGEISANQNRMFLPARIDVTTGYQLGSDRSVQFPPLVVCGAHYQDPLAGLMRGEVFSGYLSASMLDVSDLADVAAAFKNRERLRDLAFGCVHNCFAELGIALAADGIEPSNSHSGLLHLIDRPSRFDCMDAGAGRPRR